MKATVNNPGKCLNVRSNAGKQYPVVFQLKKGDVVEILDKSENDWWQIQYNGRIGWAYSKYLDAGIAAEEPKKEELPFVPEQVSHEDLVNLVKLMRASINGLYDELDRLEEMVGKL